MGCPVEIKFNFTLLSSTSRMPGLLKFLLNAVALCQALRIRLLMLSLIFVGRNSGGWLQIPSLIQLRCGSLSTCLQSWLPWFRTAVLLLSYSWPGSLDSAFLGVSPSEIHFLPSTTWQIAPIRVSMPNGRLGALCNCYVSGQDSPAFVD